MLSVLFPQKCPVCGRLDKYDGSIVCRDCAKKFPVISGTRCIRCSKAVETDDVLCGDCKKRQFSYTCGYALWSYSSEVKKLIADFKYGGRRDYTDYLVSELMYHAADSIRRWNPDVIVPVPLNYKRYRQRGFNQAEIIAEGISRKSGIRLMKDVLIRNKNTRPQKRLDDKERADNLHGAFEIDKDKLKNYGNIKKALIIDDIYTTGSTIDACASLLGKEGIESFFATLCIGDGF